MSEPTGGLKAGDQIYVQWRVRFRPEMLIDSNFLDSNGQPIPDRGLHRRPKLCSGPDDPAPATESYAGATAAAAHK